ncbi:hypothetical protein [Microbacterium sp. Marseille-Q6965]|uniref:hypothetical protein n=1 Tax=Microbacterium sp. Marseille-Q6965 TaxID=2965072 RepID=UPI0021B77611|nr:hypothetical protein [Microbacterium sp. Marseille-Q6965]
MDSVMPDDEPGEGLVSRVRVIEQQPLAQRAAAYVALHDELARRLESAPGETSAGQGGEPR